MQEESIASYLKMATFQQLLQGEAAADWRVPSPRVSGCSGTPKVALFEHESVFDAAMGGILTPM